MIRKNAIKKSAKDYILAGTINDFLLSQDRTSRQTYDSMLPSGLHKYEETVYEIILIIRRSVAMDNPWLQFTSA